MPLAGLRALAPPPPPPPAAPNKAVVAREAQQTGEAKVDLGFVLLSLPRNQPAKLQAASPILFAPTAPEAPPASRPPSATITSSEAAQPATLSTPLSAASQPTSQPTLSQNQPTLQSLGPSSSSSWPAPVARLPADGGPPHPNVISSDASTSPVPVPVSVPPTIAPTSPSPRQDEYNQQQQGALPASVYAPPPRQFRPDRLATIDLIIIVIYLCLLLSTSISTMIRSKKSAKKKAALTGQKAQAKNSFLASGRKMNWFTIGLSIFASNLGSEHFIGLSGSAAANGIGVVAFEMNSLIILQIATWVFLPVLIVSKISTLPEYMSKRFGGKRIRTYLAILSILLYIFTKISVNLYSGGIFIQQAIGWNLYTSAMFILALTCIMTLTGGIKGAMVIDNLQAIVMTIGASLVATKALMAIGGWQGLKHKYSLSIPQKVPANLTHCAQPNPRAFQMLRPYDDRNMPWLGFLLGQTPASIYFWSADQMMLQRFLSARSLAHGQGSGVFAGYLKVLPLLFMVIPGMISRCLFTDEVACIDPLECQKYCQSSVSCSNTAYPRLVLELMPMGARGMMVAAMVAALMGDLCNVFNSASALFSCDIYPLFRKHASSKEQNTAGRVFVISLVLASIMWIPVIQEMQGGQLYIYIQAVAGVFTPPIAAVYLCAVLWRRTNETGAFWSLMVGFGLGILRMVMTFMYKEPSCGQHEEDLRPWALKVHYMYYALFLFLATLSCCLLVSLLTKPPAPFRLIRTTFWTRFDTKIRKDDKNVFEMKYSGATTGLGAAGGAGSNSSSLPSSASKRALIAGSEDSVRGEPGSSSSLLLAGSGQQQQQANGAQKLFTIEEDGKQQRAAGDRSVTVLDIDKAAAAAADKEREKARAPEAAPKRPALQHQASLSASASAAVGAASEAGKLIANRLATEVNLKVGGIVLAAASHLKGTGSAGVKFQNLRADEDDDEDDDDEDEDDDTRNGEEEDDTNRESTTMDEEEEAEENRKQQKRNKRSQSVLSAALYSYKQKQGGYKQALNEDEEEDEEEEDDDDDDGDEKRNLNKSSSDKRTSNNAKPLERSSSNQQSVRSKGRAHRNSARRTSGKRRRLYEEDDVEASNKRYKCLDNSVALLIKTRLEESILRVATIAVILVGIGIFIILSLPPDEPPRDVVNILIKN